MRASIKVSDKLKDFMKKRTIHPPGNGGHKIPEVRHGII
jgi:hypothetical protein